MARRKSKSRLKSKTSRRSKRLSSMRRRRSRRYKPKPYSKKRCKRGYISRRSYRTKSKRGRKSRKVKSSCVKSPKSRRGRGLKSKRSIPFLKKGTLGKFGYKVSLSTEDRHAALRKAVASLGKATVDRKLNAIRVLTKNTQPANSKKYAADLKYTKNL